VSTNPNPNYNIDLEDATMATDIKLDQSDGTHLVLEAQVVKIEGADLMLDSAQRRTGGGTFRRALVHDTNDGLTINFNKDYPGGVTISDVVEITPLAGHLVVRGGLSYEEQSRDPVTGAFTRHTVDVTEVINKLYAETLDLRNKVAALEARLDQ